MRYRESGGEVRKHLQLNLRTKPIKQHYKAMDIEPILPSLLVRFRREGVGSE